VLNEADLEAAVAEGIVTRQHAEALRAFSLARRSLPGSWDADDERFRFLNGFNDVFLALGVALLIAAFLGFVWSPKIDYNVARSPIWPFVTAPIVLWGLAELLITRHRAVLPGIVIAAGFVGFVALAATTYWPSEKLTTITSARIAPLGGGNPGEVVIRAGEPSPRVVRYWLEYWSVAGAAGLLAASAFYWRFRLPFALLLIAGGAALLIKNAVMLASGADHIGLNWAIALLVGLAIFVAALCYDVRDPTRLTRRADCGFWLHLAAAPLIINPLVARIVGDTANNSSLAPENIDIWPAVAIIAMFGMLSLIALIIDRRALLVSSLVYLGAAIGYAFVKAVAPPGAVVPVTLAVVGVLVLTLGLGWRRLRGLVLAPYHGQTWLKYLPPVHA